MCFPTPLRLPYVELQVVPTTVAVCRTRFPGAFGVGLLLWSVRCWWRQRFQVVFVAGSRADRFRVLQPRSACLAWVMTRAPARLLLGAGYAFAFAGLDAGWREPGHPARAEYNAAAWPRDGLVVMRRRARRVGI